VNDELKQQQQQQQQNLKPKRNEETHINPQQKKQ